jgi:hypothetical protein
MNGAAGGHGFRSAPDIQFPYPGQLASGGASGGRTAAVSPWSPLVIACVVMVAALSVMAPIIGTAIALALLLALRAASTTGRQLARRRAGEGRKASEPFVAAALYPVALLRSALGLVLLAPVAVLGFCVAVAITIIVVPVHPLPQAVALGAGALVAIVGIGPGSGGGRAVLASLFSSLGRTTARLTVVYVGIMAIAAWASLSAWSRSGAAAYWPVASVHTQLAHMPTVRTMLTDVRNSLLTVARRFGL